jgi:hypothetical protein
MVFVPTISHFVNSLPSKACLFFILAQLDWSLPLGLSHVGSYFDAWKTIFETSQAIHLPFVSFVEIAL